MSCMINVSYGQQKVTQHSVEKVDVLNLLWPQMTYPTRKCMADSIFSSIMCWALPLMPGVITSRKLPQFWASCGGDRSSKQTLPTFHLLYKTLKHYFVKCELLEMKNVFYYMYILYNERKKYLYCLICHNARPFEKRQ